MMIKTDPINFIKNILNCGGQVHYMPNGGNLGDNLIAASTIQQFQVAGLPWRMMVGGKENLKENDILVYGGGGALVPLYEGGIDCLKFLLGLGRRVVVLPHTVRGHEDFWATASNLTVFCRDICSFEYLRNFKNIEVFLSDDMATRMSLNLDPFLGIKDIALAVKKEFPEPRILNAFRKDGESLLKYQREGIDLSDYPMADLKSVASIYAKAVFFLTVIANYSMVKTDRLHVAIGASLIGVETKFYDNSYGKNKAVYENTLRDKFPTLHFLTA